MFALIGGCLVVAGMNEGHHGETLADELLAEMLFPAVYIQTYSRVTCRSPHTTRWHNKRTPFITTADKEPAKSNVVLVYMARRNSIKVELKRRPIERLTRTSGNERVYPLDQLFLHEPTRFVECGTSMVHAGAYAKAFTWNVSAGRHGPMHCTERNKGTAKLCKRQRRIRTNGRGNTGTSDIDSNNICMRHTRHQHTG